jgi:hypothetical protein
MIIDPRVQDEILAHIELDPNEEVCDKCHYVYWGPMGYCTTCRSRHE